MKSLIQGTIIALAGLALSGCASKVEIAPEGQRPGGLELLSSAPENPNGATGVLEIDEMITKTCGLPTPHFNFDSSRVKESSDANLDKVATCFSTGPLAGRNVLLVGHTDPRGETEYNYGLGQRRAGGVATYIEGHGVKTSQVSTSSRGAIDATGKDPAGWAQDRRVDMKLNN